MELIILYGPPAVGKFSIAEKLAEGTGFKIFQNNATVRALEPLFDFGTPEFLRTLARVRLAMLEEAARSTLPGLIFTFCYARNVDEEFLSDAIAIFEQAGRNVHLVHLTASENVLLERVTNDSRRTHGKILTEDMLRSTLRRYDFFTPYPDRESLRLDTSSLSVQEAVAKIISNLELDSEV
ncbi:MAG TPA: AAA family ATPase [Candidatus Kapabacteria bacterium]|nr:AAA family ATPase [Candidatus Kapabacteria bacterium]